MSLVTFRQSLFFGTMFLMVLCLFLPTLTAETESAGAGGTFSVPSSRSGNEEFQSQFQDALQSGNDFSGATDGPVDVTLPDGGTATLQGNVEVSGGRISADGLTFGDAVVENVRGFRGFGDGFEADELARLDQGGTLLTNARGVRFSSGELRAEQAEGYRQGETRLALADGLSVSGQDLELDGASLLVAGAVSVQDVPPSKIRIDIDVVLVDPHDTSRIPVRVSGGPEAMFEGLGTIKITPGDPVRYDLDNGSLLINRTLDADRASTNTSTVVFADAGGMQRVLLNPDSSFHYLDDDIRRDFVLHLPESGKAGHAICVLRSANSTHETCDSVVDFPNRHISLAGVIDYRRYGIDGETVSDLLTGPVYQGLDANTLAILTLDPGFLFIDDIVIGNPAPATEGLLAMTFLGRYPVYERFNGSVIRRFGRFTEGSYPNLIRTYRSFDKPPITVVDETLVQHGPGAGRVTAVCDRCRLADRFREDLASLYLPSPRGCPLV